MITLEQIEKAATLIALRRELIHAKTQDVRGFSLRYPNEGVPASPTRPVQVVPDLSRAQSSGDVLARMAYSMHKVLEDAYLEFMVEYIKAVDQELAKLGISTKEPTK